MKLFTKNIFWIAVKLSVIAGLMLGSYIFGFTNYPKVFPIAPQPTLNQPLNADKLMELVNEWRVSQGYQPYKTSVTSCGISRIRISETKTNFSHEGFVGTRFCGPGCSLGENLVRNMKTEEITLNAWLTSASHSANLKANFPYSCISTDGSNAAQIFSNL